MYWLIKENILMAWRYKMRTINLLLNPFFMLAPYILIAKNFGMAARTLETMVLWAWLCQLIYCISYGIQELKMEGTLAVVLMAPFSFLTFQVAFFVYLMLENALTGAITIIFSTLFLGVTIECPLEFIGIWLLGGIGSFCFAVGYSVLAFTFKRLQGLNTFLHQVFGFLSGYTTPIKNFAIPLRFISYLIPLTFAILAIDQSFSLSITQIIIYLIVCAAYLLLGQVFINKSMTSMKRRGDFELW